MTISYLNPAALPPAVGYTHVTVTSAGRLIHISGQVAKNAAGNVVGRNDFGAQTEQVFENLRIALLEVGASFSNIVKLVSYVVDLSPDRAAIVRTLRSHYLDPNALPAATMVGITSLASPDLLIEIEAVAVMD